MGSLLKEKEVKKVDDSYLTRMAHLHVMVYLQKILKSNIMLENLKCIL